MCMFPAAGPGIWGDVFCFAMMSWDGMFVREARCVVSGIESVEVGMCGEVPVTLSHPPARTTSVPMDKIRGIHVLCNIPRLFRCMCCCVSKVI
jgi:hypothetical protein